MPDPGYDPELNRCLDRLAAQRRSIRKYRPDKVSRKDIAALARCAAQMPAPSNRWPVRLIHIESPGIKKRIRLGMESGFAWLLDRAAGTEKPKKNKRIIHYYWRFSAFMLDAPVLFAAGTVPETRSFTGHLAAAGILDPFRADAGDADITTGIYLSALVHKARALGLGTCILTAPLVFIRDMDGLAQEIGRSAEFSAGVSIRAFVTAGYAAETPASPGKPGAKDILVSI